MHNLFADLPTLLKTIGYTGFTLFLFAESGLFIGFFLPGDSLLFTAGVLAATGFFSPVLLIILGIAAAISGDSVGFATGRALGPRLFKKENTFLFNKKNLEKTKTFYEKHGPATILLARVIPVVRTFAPMLAGASHMPYKKFLAYNICGGVVWVGAEIAISYFLGTKIPNLDHYILPIALAIIATSFIPVVWNAIKSVIDEKKKTR